MPADYKAGPYIESDLIMGNADKMVFLLKDLIANLSYGVKSVISPVIIGKLDLTSINSFNFPQVPISFFDKLGIDVNYTKAFIET